MGRLTSSAQKHWTQIKMSTPFEEIIAEICELYLSDSIPWVVGYSGNSSRPLLLRTADGGATWTDSSSSVLSAPGVSIPAQLYSGFALDASHIWLGGNGGLLLYNDHGGAP